MRDCKRAKNPTGVAHSPLLLQAMPHRLVATHIPFVIIRTPRSMKKIGPILLAAVVFCLASPLLTAESDDPSETFLKAYMTAQQGEKLEHENQFKAALAKYRFAGSLIEQLRKAHPDWQPAIVEYRGRKESESIQRVQDKASTQESVNAPAPPAENAAAVPPEPAPTQVAKGPVAPLPAAKPAPASTPNEVAIEQATRKLRDRVDQLEAELQKSRTQMSAAENEKRSLNSRRDETKARAAEADQKVASANKERDDALTQLKGLKDTEQRVEVLVAENSNLKQKLADAEKTVREISADKPKQEKELADVRKQIGDLQTQLAASQKQNQTYQTTVAQLRSQQLRSEEHTSELQSRGHLVCRLLLEKKKKKIKRTKKKKKKKKKT